VSLERDVALGGHLLTGGARSPHRSPPSRHLARCDSEMSLQSTSLLRLVIAIAIFCAMAVGNAADSFGQTSVWSGSASRGAMRYRGPLLSIEIGTQPAPPAWHYQRVPPTTAQSLRAQERYYYDLDRMHRYQTREERYASDFRDRYSTGDPFYHTYRGSYPRGSIEPVFPPSYPHYGRPVIAPETRMPSPPVAGLAYSRSDAGRRSVFADADVPDLLRAAANRLTASLSRMRDGKVWLDQLQPQRIVAAIDQAEFPGVLADLVSRYNGVVNSPRLVLVAEANGFRDTHQLLAQYVQLQSRFPGAEYSSPLESVYGVPEGAMEVDINHRSETRFKQRSEPAFEPSLELNRPEVSASASESTEPVSSVVPRSLPANIQWLPTPRGEPDRGQ